MDKGRELGDVVENLHFSETRDKGSALDIGHDAQIVTKDRERSGIGVRS